MRRNIFLLCDMQPADSQINHPRATLTRALTFPKGLVDALPIFFGYLSVGFAFGICAHTYGHPAWSPLLMSATHISGTGQFAVINLLHAGSGFWTIVLGVIVFNLRYILMALAVAQRLPSGIGPFRRMLIAMGDTDEIVGVAVKQTLPLNFPYMMGLLVCSYAGWFGGTLIGVCPLTCNLFPAKLVDAFGIALYAMFLAIIIPGARKSRPELLCVVMAAALSTGLRLLPRHIDPGWITLIAGISSAVIAAILFPKKNELAEKENGNA